MAIPRLRPGNYPAVLSYGFRPFFLLGSLYAGLSILMWLPMLYGRLGSSSVFPPVDWHIHEMVFGYVAAIITGFLLTAIPNWTGRLPVQGLPLAALVAIWLTGRFAVFFSADIGWLAAAVIDSAFLLAVAVAAAVEIVTGRNWKNLKVLAPVSVLFAANVVYHLEVRFNGEADVARRLGISAAVVLIMIIGGRIIPSFTRNWLARENPGRLPVPFNRFDAITIVGSTLALVVWTCFPDSAVSGTALLVATGLNLARLGRWAGDRTWRDPLVLILHIAYAFVPVGFILAALAVLLPDTVAPAAGLHALGTGAIGAMTLAVMVRATLGHTGRELHASNTTCLVFSAIIASAILRIAYAFMPSATPLLHASATAWTLAFLGYAAVYGGMLIRPRLRARQPNVA